MSALPETAARKELESYSPEYMIVGFIPDKIRGIPAKFQRATYLISTQDELLDTIEEFSFFRVFSIDREVGGEQYWRDRKKSEDKQTAEVEERALYEKLKAKYGNK